MSDEAKPTTDDGAVPDGAADAGSDNPDARPPDYSDLNDARLRASHAKLQGQFDKLKGQTTNKDTLAEARRIRTEQAQITAELRKRADDARALQDEMAAIEGEDVTLPEIPGEGEDDAEQPEVTAGDAPAAPAVTQQPAVAAGATPPTAAAVAAARTPQTKAAKTASTVPARARAPWLAAAAANDGSVMFGAEVALTSLGEQVNRLQRHRGQHMSILASLPEFGTDRGELLSDRHGAVVNDELIREAVEAFEIRQGLRTANPSAMTAAICEPLDIIREIPNPGRSKETPFGSSLPFRGAGRLGFTFTRAMKLSDVASGTEIWTSTDQAAISGTDEATWKHVVDVTCGTPVDTTAEELTWGLRYEESTDLSSPERIADALDALMTVEKRVREGYLLRRFDLLSSGASWTAPSIGALPDLIEIIVRRIAAAAYTERLELPGATVWLPPGLVELLAVDRARKGQGAAADRAANALAELNEALPEGVTVVQLRDISDNLDADGDIPDETVTFGAGEALANPAAARTALAHLFCGTFRIRWGWPSAFIAYSTGMTNFGVLRDASLIRQNKAIQFGREWLGLDKHGPQASGYVDVTLSNSGIRSGLMPVAEDDTIGCVSGD